MQNTLSAGNEEICQEDISREQQLLVMHISMVLLGLDHRLGLHHPQITWKKGLLAGETDVCTVNDFVHFFFLFLPNFFSGFYIMQFRKH